VENTKKIRVTKDDKVTIVSVSIPSLSSLSYDDKPTIIINRDATAIKAGEKVITASGNVENCNSYNINQDNVNVISVPSDFAIQIRAYHLNVSTVSLFTSNISDEEIFEKARLWCREIITITAKELDLISQNLSKMSDLSSDAKALFVNNDQK
jgi:post-segregation antitoxin (ccd killing protein)